jgi:hypothetical protein
LVNSDDDDDATEDDSDPDTSIPMDAPKYRRGRGTTAAMSTLSMKAMKTAATWYYRQQSNEEYDDDSGCLILRDATDEGL